jgi:all-trans-retinol 13,14-reductase
MSSVVVQHYRNGAYYPTGGSSVIAKSIVRMILSTGGHAFVRAPVSHILLDESGGKVLGVHVR